eukprot:TRINITY_DN90577_c0_g1_i1.p1 TRINITY_DN90577_c0_g1~~TRINITY_DN90577_c0_g1_i1.p1  ORF type:complete len:326 (-),score=81.17 TRINITY_DN90577_c0_g1_i1:40-1017(-)
MYSNVLKKWRAKEAEEASLQNPLRQRQQSGLPKVNKSKSVGWIHGGKGLDDKHTILLRVRQRLNAAKNVQRLSWEHLFKLCDEDRSGTLTWNEFKSMARNILQVPEQTVCSNDLRVLFDEVDSADGADSNGVVDLGELLQYLARGLQDPDILAARAQARLMRVRRNLQMAFVALDSNEAEVRKIFAMIDVDQSDRLSEYEFEGFVREHLKLSHWDVGSCDLKEFYDYMDENGDGIDCEELLDYVRKAHKYKGQLGGQSFTVDANPNRSPSRRKLRTYKECIEEGLRQSSSSKSLPDPQLTMPFAGTGREKPPTNRFSASGSNFFL